MFGCQSCGGLLRRVPRYLGEQLRWESAYECDGCGQRSGVSKWYMAFIARESACPRCGTYNLQRLSRRDRIDRMWKNPISLIQACFGAPIHWCPFCRLQFYDLRKLASALPKRTRKAG